MTAPKTTPITTADIAQFVNWIDEQLRYTHDAQRRVAIAIAWLVVWMLNTYTPEDCPTHLTLDYISKHADDLTLTWMQAMTWDAAVSGTGADFEPVASWIVGLRNPHLVRKTVQKLARYGRSNIDVLGDAYMAYMAVHS